MIKVRRPKAVKLSKQLQQKHPTWSKAKCDDEAKKIITEGGD